MEKDGTDISPDWRGVAGALANRKREVSDPAASFPSVKRES
jgi:hypothetical protein